MGRRANNKEGLLWMRHTSAKLEAAGAAVCNLLGTLARQKAYLRLKLDFAADEKCILHFAPTYSQVIVVILFVRSSASIRIMIAL